MNILIVCLQGMTSGVMAKKLTRLAEEREESYVFRACGWQRLENHKSWADIILLTPQAESRREEIETVLKDREVPMISVPAVSISFNQIPETYQNIKQLIISENESFSLSVQIRSLCRDYLPYAVFILSGGLLFYLLYAVTGYSVFYTAFCVSLGGLSIYTIVSAALYFSRPVILERALSAACGILAMIAVFTVFIGTDASREEILADIIHIHSWTWAAAVFSTAAGLLGPLLMRCILSVLYRNKEQVYTNAWTSYILPVTLFVFILVLLRQAIMAMI